MAAGFRVAVAGASGALGREVASLIGERGWPVAELLAYATDRSAGEEVEWGAETAPVEEGTPPWSGLDLVVVCTPASAALEWVRQALRAEVPCIDASGALVGSSEVPLVHVDLGCPSAASSAPLLAQPAGPVLAWAAPLATLHALAGLRTLVATVLRPAVRGGRGGLEALSDETVALLSHRDPEPPAVFPGPVAFDCVPLASDAREDVGALLERLVGARPRVVERAVQVPVFTGEGSVLYAETERPIDLGAWRTALEKAPGVELRADTGWGPGTREAAGQDVVLVGAPRVEPVESGGAASLWVAADGIRLAARNAVRLAEIRLGIR